MIIMETMLRAHAVVVFNTKKTKDEVEKKTELHEPVDMNAGNIIFALQKSNISISFSKI